MNRDAGFTLAELMIVVAIIAIITSIAIPNFIGWQSNQRFAAASQDILSAIRLARSRAMKDHDFVAVQFNTAVESYTVFLDNGAGSGSRGDGVQNGSEKTLKSGKMPGGVDLQNTSFGDTLKFDSRGLLSGVGGTVNLKNTRGETKQINVNLSGHSRID